jgi:hypothetical protein
MKLFCPLSFHKSGTMMNPYYLTRNYKRILVMSIPHLSAVFRLPKKEITEISEIL